MSRWDKHPTAQALTEQSIQRTSVRNQVYLGPATPVVASLHDSPDWPVFIDAGVQIDPHHAMWAMSLGQARELFNSLGVVLTAADVRAEGAA